MIAAMRKKRSAGGDKKRRAGRGLGIAIVGTGSLGRVLALALHASGAEVAELVVRGRADSMRRGRELAKRVGARLAHPGEALTAKLVILAVPDAAIGAAASDMARAGEWKGKTVLHTSGALDSSVLAELKKRGASVGSAHPLNSFVASSTAADLRNISFAVEGDAAAVRVAEKMARALGAEPFRISAKMKPAYHAFGALASPILVALLSAAEEMGKSAGVKDPKSAMEPMVRRTVENFFRDGASASFSGPMKRGDVETVERHLRAVRSSPRIRNISLALAAQAAARLPVRNKAALQRLLAAEQMP